MSIHEKLNAIQTKLKAPKSQFNSFGKYNYRNCEDILEAVKPLLSGLVLTLSDNIKAIGDRVYVEATATVSDGEASVSVKAFARESLDKKGMDDSQITGAASSYARKYALNGLFAIDDNKDADSKDNSQPEAKASVVTKEQATSIANAAKVAGVPDAVIAKAYGVKTIQEIPAEFYEKVINRLKATVEAA